MVMEELQRLVAAGAWEELRTQIPRWLATAPATDHIRLHATMINALFRTAKEAADFHDALRHAHTITTLAEEGTLAHTWALYQLTSLSVSAGLYSDVRPYGERFLAAVQQHPSLIQYTPKIFRAFSHVAYREHAYEAAIALRQQAMQLFEQQGNRIGVARVTYNLIWALVKVGRIDEAEALLPKEHLPEMEHLHAGATVTLLAARGRYAEALELGQAALPLHRGLHDYTDASDLFHVLGDAARKLGRHELASSFDARAVAYVKQQCVSYTLHAEPQKMPEGGEQQHESPSLLGSERCGNSFTTGIG